MRDDRLAALMVSRRNGRRLSASASKCRRHDRKVAGCEALSLPKGETAGFCHDNKASPRGATDGQESHSSLAAVPLAALRDADS